MAKKKCVYVVEESTSSDKKHRTIISAHLTSAEAVSEVKHKRGEAREYFAGYGLVYRVQRYVREGES